MHLSPPFTMQQLNNAFNQNNNKKQQKDVLGRHIGLPTS